MPNSREKIREVLKKYTEQFRYSKSLSEVRRIEFQTTDQTTISIINIFKEMMPEETTHWIQHGEIGHPHTTEHDSGWNAYHQELLKRLK